MTERQRGQEGERRLSIATDALVIAGLSLLLLGAILSLFALLL